MRNRDKPATGFGYTNFNNKPRYDHGLTKHEAAAIAAMQGLLAGSNPASDYAHPERYADSAVNLADALFDRLDGNEDADA